jgi:O-acetyl-ADP-ribose deacetylase (regulator of RNase III)
MKKIKGDLIQLVIEGKFDVILHGCNCFCAMGKGIAKQIKETFPEVYKIDCQTKKGDKTKLGTNTYTFIDREDHRFLIVNMYTQYNFIGKKVLFQYDAFRECLKNLKIMLSNISLSTNKTEFKIGYPAIGCGLAGGDWNKVEKILNEELEGYNHTFVEYNKG